MLNPDSTIIKIWKCHVLKFLPLWLRIPPRKEYNSWNNIWLICTKLNTSHVLFSTYLLDSSDVPGTMLSVGMEWWRRQTPLCPGRDLFASSQPSVSWKALLLSFMWLVNCSTGAKGEKWDCLSQCGRNGITYLNVSGKSTWHPNLRLSE